MSFHQEYLISTTAALQVGGALSGISSGTPRHSGKWIDGRKMDMQVQKKCFHESFAIFFPYQKVHTTAS